MIMSKKSNIRQYRFGKMAQMFLPHAKEVATIGTTLTLYVNYAALLYTISSCYIGRQTFFESVFCFLKNFRR